MIDRFTFGSTLARKHQCVSLRTLAKILGTSASTLSRIERGKKVDADLFMTICQWMGEDAESFLEKKPVIYVSVNALSDDWKFEGE